MIGRVKVPSGRNLLRNRAGAVVPIVAVCIVMLVGCAAIAIDIGMLLDSRAQAQRAADGAALAGASALLEFRQSSQTLKQDSAIARAQDIATRNSVLGGPISTAELGLQFSQNDHRIAATITRGSIAPLFAGIFGVNSLQVAAEAHALVFQGSSASCLKPFGVPDQAPFTQNSIYTEVLIWQKSADGMYPLVKHLVVPNVRTSIESQLCNTSVVSVGDTLELQSGTASMAGQVDQGLTYLRSLDTTLEWDPALYGHLGYSGFNRADWQTSSRVINLVTYDPNANVGNTEFVVTGFLTVFMNRHVNVQQGNDLLQYGIILPNKPVGGPCTPPNCSPTSWGIRLVQ
ncbi:MAG TPA: pilus assembly protein TadG-related protein [Longimicrobiales bacterium]|nr:pilus assembly protein TadG-related protein [Longimicrobiales bacterium]